jgi:hypothetical protein
MAAYQAKTTIDFCFSPLFPPFSLFTLPAATISLIHQLKFGFFGFKKSQKISIPLLQRLHLCRFHLLQNVLCESLVKDVGLGREDCTLHFPSSFFSKQVS